MASSIDWNLFFMPASFLHEAEDHPEVAEWLQNWQMDDFNLEK